MYTCSDIQNFANYISQSGLDLKHQYGKKSFFVPFFVDQSTDKFKKSVVISSAYLDLCGTSSFCNSNKFKINTAIPQLVEKSTGISSSDFMYKCYDINNSIDNKEKINYSYLSKNLDIFFKEKEV